MVLALVIAAVLTVVFPLVAFPEIYSRDWSYFESLSLVVRSNVLQYHVFPLHDPWCGGGGSLVANPQTRIFSPLGLLDIILPPYWANLAGLVVYAAVGMWGMYRLLRWYGISREIASVGAVVFINGSWFGLHFAEGHIAYGAMQLLPWMLLCVLQIERPRWLLLLAALLSVCLLDGALYAFIFSILLCVTAILFGLKRWRTVAVAIWERPVFTACCAIAIGLAAAPRVIPLYLEHGDRVNVTERFSVPLKTVVAGLFWPFQRISFPTVGSPYFFQEFGCYLGLCTAAVVAWALVRDGRYRRATWRLCLLAVFWFWVGSGWADAVNPWQLFQRIPLVNNAHIQSRLWLLMYLAYVIVAAHALNRLTLKNWRTLTLLGVIVVESVVVRNYPFEIYRDYARKTVANRLIDNTTIEETQAEIRKPYLYLAHNKASRACYEPAALATHVVASADPAYRGEVFVDSGDGEAVLDSYVPGRIQIRVTGEGPRNVTVNTNDLGYWTIERAASNSSVASILSHRGERLRIQLNPDQQVVVLQLRPPYLWPVVAMWTSGWLLFAGLWMWAKRFRV